MRHRWRRRENNAPSARCTCPGLTSIAFSPFAILLLYRLVSRESIEHHDPRAKNSYVERSRAGRAFRRFWNSIQILCWQGQLGVVWVNVDPF